MSKVSDGGSTAGHPKDDIDATAANMNKKYYGTLLEAYTTVLNCPELQTVIQEDNMHNMYCLLLECFLTCLQAKTKHRKA